MTVNTALQKLPYASIFYNASGLTVVSIIKESLKKLFWRVGVIAPAFLFSDPLPVFIICHAKEPSTPFRASVVCSYGDAKNGQSKRVEEYEDDEKED